MIETTRAEHWLRNRLAGDAQLSALVGSRIHGYLHRGALPSVVFQLQGATDLMGVGPARVMAALTYLVRGIDQTESWDALAPIADRIDAVLHAARYGDAADGVVIGCVREEPFVLVEEDDGMEYRHLGGVYKLWAQ